VTAADPAPPAGDGDPAGLPPGLAAALDGFARQDAVLVAVDFDGTLAPLVRDPAQARPLPAGSEALRALGRTAGTHVALVSGRTLADLLALADPPPGAVLVGSHGAEVVVPEASRDGGRPAEVAPATTTPDVAQPGARELLARLRSELDRITGVHAGTFVEVKPTSVVLHTRAADREAAQAATAEVLDGPAAWPGVHVTRGKEVVELAVTDATKGRALQDLRGVLGLPPRGAVLYLGDDVTDERAFAVLDDDGGDVTVKVGEGDTAARHRVPGPPEVAALLARLAALRAARHAR
jgi:trehalose-phosphatase